MYNMEIYCTSLYCIENLAAGFESNTGFQYNTDEYNLFPYCTYHCIITYLLYS